MKTLPLYTRLPEDLLDANELNGAIPNATGFHEWQGVRLPSRR